VLLETGKIGNADAGVFPFRVDAPVARARARTVRTSTARPATAGPDQVTAWSSGAASAGRRRSTTTACGPCPSGNFVDVMANGFGAMSDYSGQVDARDRWAIAAYIRALQLSAHATLSDVRPTPGRGCGDGSRADRRRTDPGVAAVSASAHRGRRGRTHRRGRRRGYRVGATQFYASYLMAYMWCLGITLGCLALGMVHQLSGGAWGVVLRRPIGAAARVLPVLTLLFVPILAGMKHL